MQESGDPGIIVVLFGLPLSHLFSRCAPFRALTVSALFLGAGFGLTALADRLVSLPLYTGSIAIWTLGEIIFVPVSATVVAAFSPASRRGTYQGIARASWGLAACAGPLAGGFVLQRWSASLWIGCAILSVLIACGFVLIRWLKKQSQASEEDIVPPSEILVPGLNLDQGEDVVGGTDFHSSSLPLAQKCVRAPNVDFDADLVPGVYSREKG